MKIGDMKLAWELATEEERIEMTAALERILQEEIDREFIRRILKKQ
jgi:hypothetical protein